MRIGNVIRTLPPPELENLAVLLALEPSEASPQALEEEVYRLYNSVPWAMTKATAINVFGKGLSHLTKSQHKDVTARAQWAEPSYEELVSRACKLQKVHQEDAPLELLEEYLAQAIFVKTLAQMPPEERRKFFTVSIDFGELAAKSGRAHGKSFLGETTALGALGLAQASGFGVYLFATSSLGFLTSALGITLPFTIYMGVTSAISVIIGPVGWTAVGAVILKKLADPNWKRLLPVILYLIAHRHKAPEDHHGQPT